MKRVVFGSVVFVAVAVLIGCGTSNKPPASSKLSITPTTASVVTGQVVQFTATTTDNPTPAVNWYVKDLSLGDRTVGMIDFSGRYIAPGTVPNPAKVTVKAVLATDTTQTASATVTITAGTAIAITLTPSTGDNISVAAGQTQQFTATVTNTADTAVIWSVVDPSGNDIPGGNATYGTIDQFGLYSAPATVPIDSKTKEPVPVTIKATAAADTTKTATVTFAIKPFTYISVTPSVVAALAAGGKQQFTATRNGQPVDVTWALHCNSQAEGACGSIDPTGLYTAPLSPPPGGDVNITASTTDPNDHAGGATVTVQFSNASLTGKYALSFSGKNAGAAYTAAGSIAFDGSANITGGELEINNGTLSSVVVTGGTYNIGTDGRGVATLDTASGPLNWRIVLANHSQVYVIASTTSGAVGSGTLDLQDPDTFNVASISGAYALNAAGPNAHNAATFAMAGAVSADGAGQITGGVLDINNAGDVRSSLALTTASYTAPSANGRGSLTLTSSFGTQNFVYYLVDADHLKLLSSDGQVATGNLTKQATGPFSTATWQGGFAFVLAGSRTGQPLGEGGVLQLNGAGSITTGTMDINNNGNMTPAQTMTGAYEVADANTGRTTVTATVNGAAMHYVIYPQMDGFYVLGTDATEITSGIALAQGDTDFKAGAITGTYALSLAGADLTGNPGEEDVLGQIMPNGATAITGVLDINDNVIARATNPLEAAEYHVAANGRFSATLPTAFGPFTSAGFNVYVVDRARALWLETDPNRVLTGIMEKQY